MIKYVLPAVLLFSFNQTKAQDKPLAKELQNEAGFVGEESFSGDNNAIPGFAGIQYKRWLKPGKAVRVVAGTGTYEERSQPIRISYSGDTVTERYLDTRVPMAFLGAGLEEQRRFYRNLYLYAAVQFRAGIGSGKVDTVLRRSATPPLGYYYNSTATAGRGNGVHAFSAALLPFVGIKLVLRRITIGTELSAIAAGYHRISYAGQSGTGLLDFNAGQFRQQLYVDLMF